MRSAALRRNQTKPSSSAAHPRLFTLLDPYGANFSVQPRYRFRVTQQRNSHIKLKANTAGQFWKRRLFRANQRVA
jgi:hypothetical protein